MIVKWSWYVAQLRLGRMPSTKTTIRRLKSEYQRKGSHLSTPILAIKHLTKWVFYGLLGGRQEGRYLRNLIDKYIWRGLKMQKFLVLGLVMAAIALFLATTPAQAGGNDALQEEMMGRLVANLAYFQAPNFDDLDQPGVNRRLDGLFLPVGHGFRPWVVPMLQERINAERGDERVTVSAENNVLRISSATMTRWLRIHPTKVTGETRIELTEKAPTRVAKGLSAK
jgi:hypothetical protein